MFRGMRIFPIATFVLLPLGATTLIAQATVSGWYTETRVTSRVVGENGILNSAPREYTTREWLSPLGVRREGDPFVSVGAAPSYALQLRGEAVVYNVDPARRTIEVVDPQTLRPLIADQIRETATRGATVRPALHGAEHGSPMLGHRTRKVSMTFDAPDARSRRGSSVERTITTWTAVDSADSMVTAYAAACRALGLGMLTGSCSRVLRSEYSFGGPSGFTTYRVSEVVVWRREEMEVSRFAVPEGYTRRDLAAELRARRAAQDELKRLISSSDPRDRARAKGLSDSLLKELRRNQPPLRPLREDPNAVVINGGAKKKP